MFTNSKLYLLIVVADLAYVLFAWRGAARREFQRGTENFKGALNLLI